MNKEKYAMTKVFQSEKLILPAFPRTPHLPYKPNTEVSDYVSTAEDCAIIFKSLINIEEKIDGASVGMTLHNGHPIIRNRDHILRKGYFKATAAKQQFASIWTWFYKNQYKFEKLSEIGPFSVYGEWCIAAHGIKYTKLPDWFIVYDVYDYEKQYFIAPNHARTILYDCEFHLPRLLQRGEFEGNEAELESMTKLTSEFSDDQIEGIYIKVFDKDKITHRFKMVRSDFRRGQFWNPKKITKNMVVK